MITLLHGENVTASRKRLSEIKDNFDGEVVYADLNSSLESSSLFFSKRLLILENVLGVKLPEIDNDNLVFWEGKKLSATQITSFLKKYPKANVEEFKIDPVVFKFVESIGPGNQKVMMPLWKKYMATEEPEIAMTMIVRQIKLMLVNENMAPWQKERLARQASLFGEERLKKMLGELLEIDYKNKSGQSTVGLADLLEVWLLGI